MQDIKGKFKRVCYCMPSFSLKKFNMEYKVIKYGASWCQQCKIQDIEFEKNSDFEA